MRRGLHWVLAPVAALALGCFRRHQPASAASLSFEERADRLIAQMTLAEEVSQLQSASPAIPRLGIPPYNWWNEALHGVARAGLATVFPQAIALGASFDPVLVGQIAEAISDEARAKYHQAIREGHAGEWYRGLTFWAPNVNLFRDPRWGRGQETYGEDPFLTAKLGVAFIRGMQGDDPKYFKTIATPKHFAVHSGPEATRHAFDAEVSPKDLSDSYLPHFEAAIREGGAGSVMAAYNRLNRLPCSASPPLLADLLRGRWGFQGYVVADCDAIEDIYRNHHVAPDAPHAAALALKAGTDLDCGKTYATLTDAVSAGLVEKAKVDQAVRRLLLARLKLGMFDPPEQVPFTNIPESVIDSPEHRSLALKAAQEGMVLLRNDIHSGGPDGGPSPLLPLSAQGGKIAVIGPSADSVEVLVGNYAGTPSKAVTFLEGIRAARTDPESVGYAKGSDFIAKDQSGFASALELAKGADLSILCLGLSPQIEGEGDTPGSGDRADLSLPAIQRQLLDRVLESGKPVVVVLTGGAPFILDVLPKGPLTVLMAWYPGEEGGSALADLLFGRVSPSGRLPITLPRTVDDLPPFESYAMEDRTYRYTRKKPGNPFGMGMGYASFRYQGLSAPRKITSNGSFEASIDVENAGATEADEVVQLYVLWPAAQAGPHRSLRGFSRIHLKPKERSHVSFALGPKDFSSADDNGEQRVVLGEAILAIGGGQPSLKGEYLDPGAGQTQPIRIEAP